MINTLPILTGREKQIIQLVARGLTDKEIAQQLEIKPVTVEFHLGNIFRKLDVSSRTEAAIMAINLGLLEPYGNP